VRPLPTSRVDFPPRPRQPSSTARARDRGLAFSGDEDDLVPPSELFERADAESAIATAEGSGRRGAPQDLVLKNNGQSADPPGAWPLTLHRARP